MSTQLTPDFTPEPQREQKPIIQNESWLDVSDIARGVGFTTAVHVSINLNDALQPLQNETDGDYDQRLYDCLLAGSLQIISRSKSIRHVQLYLPAQGLQD